VFARVIVGVDGAYGGLDASALAGVLADPEADVVLARVAVPAAGTAGATDAAEEDASFTTARRVLAASVSADSTPSVSALVIEGRSIADGLHRLAEDGPADLIVVGSHHRRRTGRLWSANRTRATLRDAPCPVAVAPQGFAGGPRRPIEVIGIAYDDTPEARDALLFGRALASETGARIHALWVVERSNWTDSQSRVGRKAAEATRRLADLHGVTGVAVEGDPRHAKDALARFAQDVDLLILGSHHHALLRRIVLGDTVDGLSRRAPCPLLVMPHARRRAASRW
jgi:nucleotide-binding universal stress UspA family protein